MAVCAEECELSEILCEVPQEPCAPVSEKRITNTPPGGVMLMSVEGVDEEDVAISTQIYNNIQKVPVALFRQNDEGLKVVNPWHAMTAAELDYVKVRADEITKDAKTTDEIIKTAAEYVATNVCYDNDCYYGRIEYEEANHSPYDVLQNGSAVCYGYAATFEAIMHIENIPCVMIFSPGHAWNMVYNGKRWMLVDTTWMSYGEYEYGEFHKSSEVREEWYDFTIDQANASTSHVIEEADYTEYDNCIYTFPYLSIYEEFTIPENVTRIEENVFYGCSNFEIAFNDSLEYIGKAAFYQCAEIDGVINLKNLKELGMYAFDGCADLDGVIFGENLKTIPYAAFAGCSELDGTIDLKNVEEVGEFAFDECGDLDGVKFGKNLKKLGMYAFYECRDLDGTIDLKNAEEVGELAFYDCGKLDGVINLKNIRTMGRYAFYYCSGISGVYIGENIETIPYAAFYGCTSLKKVVADKNIKMIDEYAFGDCPLLQSFYYNGTQEELVALQKVSGKTDVFWNYVKCNYKPAMKASVSTGTDKKCTVVYEGIPMGETIIYAEWKDGKMVGINSMALSDTNTFDNISSEAKEIKVFIWKGFENMIPVCKPQSVPIK